MDNENEILARWLGYQVIDKWNWMLGTPPDAKYVVPGNFRTSNEWAGALLEKLGTKRHLTHFYNDDGQWYMHLCNVGLKDSFWTKPTGTWRDAVVDAVLEVIKRESSSRSASERQS